MVTAEEHHRYLERAYIAAPTNEYYQPAIEISEAAATIRVPVRPEFHHAMRAVHGSVYFKLLDDAGYFAAASLVTDVWLVTGSFTIYLLRPVSAGELIATGSVINRSASGVVAEALLHDTEQRLLAHGVGEYRRSHWPFER